MSSNGNHSVGGVPICNFESYNPANHHPVGSRSPGGFPRYDSERYHPANRRPVGSHSAGGSENRDAPRQYKPVESNQYPHASGASNQNGGSHDSSLLSELVRFLFMPIPTRTPVPNSPLPISNQFATPPTPKLTAEQIEYRKAVFDEDCVTVNRDWKKYAYDMSTTLAPENCVDQDLLRKMNRCRDVKFS